MAAATVVAVSDRVHIDFRKYPDTEHWQYTMRRLTTDDHGLWLWAPQGTQTQRSGEPARPATNVFIKLIAPDAWHAPIWNAAGKYEIYVDINTPGRWQGNRLRMIDLDLDVVRYRDGGEVAILDEDEFENHQTALGYPRQLVDGARNAAARIFVALETRAEPFDQVGAQHLAAAIARAG